MEENKNLAVEQTAENAENTAEKTDPAVKTYTQEEVDQIVGKKKARIEAKVRKEYDRKYGDLMDTLKQGSGKENVEEINESLAKFYEEKGIELKKRSEMSEDDLLILARADADSVIHLGADEVADEVSRLNKIGDDKLSAREKATLKLLNEHIDNSDNTNRLRKLGVADEVIDSKEFKSFRSQFKSDVPIEEVYKLYEKTHSKTDYKTIGSLKSSPAKDPAVKDFYSYEEAMKFTTEDFRKNPALRMAVERSMQKWGK